MKILKQGKNHKWYVGKIGVCTFCGTTIATEESDEIHPTSDRNEDLASVECPQCKNNIWVYPSSPEASDWKTL